MAIISRIKDFLYAYLARNLLTRKPEEEHPTSTKLGIETKVQEQPTKIPIMPCASSEKNLYRKIKGEYVPSPIISRSEWSKV